MDDFFDFTVWAWAIVSLIAMFLGSLELFLLACFMASVAVIAQEVNRS